MKKHHNLKCEEQFFNAVLNGFKTFEIRKNDRDFQRGDTFILEEYEDGKYTGLQTPKYKIKYVVKDCLRFGLADGYCVFCW